MSSCQLLYHLCPHCRLSGMLTFGHCIQLAGSLFQCWSSMLPSAFVSVDKATSLVVLDVVDLPDILLPEDQYLDMFDSESDISGDNSEDELVTVLLTGRRAAVTPVPKTADCEEDCVL